MDEATRRAFRAYGTTLVKTANFAAMTSSFFDELAKIQDDKAEKLDETRYERSISPYSMLTQDDEPGPYFPTAAPPDQPFVIIRR